MSQGLVRSLASDLYTGATSEPHPGKRHKIVDYVPADHLAQFVVALAREHLDLSEIVASYKVGLRQPAFDPRMMTALLLYACRSGLYSSRRIAKACAERVDFMMMVAHEAPDFPTITTSGSAICRRWGDCFCRC
jgi:transposase